MGVFIRFAISEGFIKKRTEKLVGFAVLEVMSRTRRDSSRLRVIILFLACS